jgi:alginate O-acetyltransferase complex protein AlgI
MHFVSIEWIAWMLLTVAMYWLFPGTWRNGVLVVITLTFLVVVDPLSSMILVIFSLLTYSFGLKGRAKGLRTIAGVAAIAGTLAYYKTQVSASPEDLLREILIPIGLSYYSFRCIHYLFERYRDDVDSHSLGEFVCYLFFLPTIVVGPIHRIGQFLEDLRAKQWDSRNLSEGLGRILYGYV